MSVNQKNLTRLGKPTNKTTVNPNSTADIRSKVPTALYDKIIMRYVTLFFFLMIRFSLDRLEKNGESDLLKQNIRTRVDQIEREMFRVYGKVDNSYKNKFRSLLANISNTNNHVSSIQIFSRCSTTVFLSSFSINEFYHKN